MTRDITEDIPLNIGNPGLSSFWVNNEDAFDIAVGGLPFLLCSTDNTPYYRQTAAYKKDQLDNSKEAGEQSLVGWWLRSQSSFHAGAGIKFYDPATGESIGYRYADSQGLDVWTKGQATLLKEVTQGHNVTTAIATSGVNTGLAPQHIRSVKWSGTNGFLLQDGNDIDRIDASGTVTHWVDHNTGGAYPVYAVCDDGTYAYWVTNNGVSGKFEMYKKLLSDPAGVPASPMMSSPSITVANATMEWVKDRIVVCINNVVYEVAPNATTLPSPVYTNPNTNYVYTSVSASGPAIYTSGYSGIKSTIQKYTLSTSGAMPTLTSASVAAEFPAGEIVHRIFYYLGYMMIGTSKGVRVAMVNDQDGSLDYGPLIVETTQPVYDFCARDRFVWCATGVSTDAGITRIDLGQSIENEHLRFAYANDLQAVGVTGYTTTALGFIGDTNRIVFCTANNGTSNGYVYAEHETNLRSSGYVTSGNVRFGTLEPKNFKLVRARGDVTYGSIDIQSIEANGDVYNLITYTAAVGTPEVSTTQPEGSQEYLAYKFTLSRDASNSARGPVLTGFQAKALPATKRQRMIQFPVWCFDVETDRYKVLGGYSGRAWERIQALEALEELGDIVNIQDFTTQERTRGIIEDIRFVRRTPPNAGFDGFGGLLTITVRTVA